MNNSLYKRECIILWEMTSSIHSKYKKIHININIKFITHHFSFYTKLSNSCSYMKNVLLISFELYHIELYVPSLIYLVIVHVQKKHTAWVCFDCVLWELDTVKQKNIIRCRISCQLTSFEMIFFLINVYICFLI